MKAHRLALLILLLLAAAGCQKEPSASGSGAEGLCRVVITAGLDDGPLTKATGVVPLAEEVVSSVQVFFYDNDVLMYTARSKGNAVSLDVQKGTYTVYALAGAPQVSETAAATPQSLKAVRSALSDNKVGSMVAFGSKAVVSLLESSGSVDMTVKRLASKVMLEKITKDFSDLGSLKNTKLTIHAVYLTNVASDCCLEGGMPESYSNRMGWAGQLAEQTRDEVEAEVTAPLTDVHTFYAYANPTVEDVTLGDWCPRHTRLVLDASFGDTRCYYVVNLPVIGRNRVYRITNLTITRPGSDNEEEIATGRTVIVDSRVESYSKGEYDEGL